MSVDSPVPYAVLGATGQQGSATIESLLARRLPVRAVVRDRRAAKALALAQRGVQIVTADQEDRDSVEEALRNVAGAFFYTTFDGADGTVGETRRGRLMAEAAARATVPFAIYSSVGGADRDSGVPHFESKRQVELRFADLLPAKFVRPTLFMDNFTGQLDPDPAGDVVLRLPMPGDVPVQMVSVRDVGRAAAALMHDPHGIDGDAVELGGDVLTLAQAAAAAGRNTHRSASYEELPATALDSDPDLQAMFAWLTSGAAYDADFTTSRRLVPDLLDFPGWLARTSNTDH